MNRWIELNDAYPFPTLGQLVYKLATKESMGFARWKPTRLPPENESLPVDMMDRAKIDDELWWYHMPPVTLKGLCGLSGWAMVRDQKVIDFTVCDSN